MKIKLPLDKDKKLSVIFRIEPGCLGPKGMEHVEEFCIYAQKAMDKIDTDFIQWLILPRFDKSDEEMEYKLTNKKLSHDKAEKYLGIFDKKLDDFEGHLHDRLAELIDEFLGQ